MYHLPVNKLVTEIERVNSALGTMLALRYFRHTDIDAAMMLHKDQAPYSLWNISFVAFVGLLIASVCTPVSAQTSAKVELNTNQLFAFADAARDRGDYATAEVAYRALSTNADGELRSEARFRLALMLANQQHRYRAAALELRHILDEKPRAARARLELARIHALLGNIGDAARELRAVEASGLPPDVERMIRFYAQALNARRPTGGNLEVTLAPDSNINQATTSGTLGTVIGNFVLDPDAQARSGLGLSVRGQGFVRLPLGAKSNLLARLSGSATVYKSPQFDDFVVSPQIGPEWVSNRGSLSVAAGPAWRWYGTKPFTFSIAANGNWQHAIGPRTQLRVDASLAYLDNRRNALESGYVGSLATSVDRAFSASMGGGLQLSVNRQGANDPGYATISGGANMYLYREFGRTTVTASLSYNHIEADKRLALFFTRRVNNDFVASLTGTFRQLRVGSIVPLARLTFERRVSSVQLYDYRRFAGELGVATAF
ncbi:MAG: hypothetical protein B7Y43_17385 [Sphingomonas sp. 28-62-20]|uniref:porin family protein n=1 Tax=Sphingomonas sp. 28-62-20 TaxID=1970433 RepID=UPI000BDDD5C4|nr:MAG: hypothetical protein B7Y43_17385 [Sphingomonas sp. 28-62-20]